MKKKLMLVPILALGALLAGCTSPASAPSVTVTASPSSSSPAPSVSTVMVVQAPTTPVKRKTVTRVVAQPAPVVVAPQSTGSLLALYRSASPANTDSYLTNYGAFFASPSQNIGCLFDPNGFVQCSITTYEFPQPGPDCNRGIAAILDSSDQPSLTGCEGYFPVRNRGAVLQYGQSVTYDSLACVSESSGVSCLNIYTGAGFTVSKQAYSPVYG